MANKRPLINSTGQLSELPPSDVLVANNTFLTQASNGDDILGLKRATDSSPTGNFLKFTNNSGVSTLFSVDIAGTILNGTWNGAVIGSSYGGAGTVNGLLKANGSGVVSAASAGTDYILSLAGTSNQITVSGSSGVLTASLPNAVTMPGSLTVTGDLTVNGTTTTVNSTVSTIQDPVIDIGGTTGGGAPSSDDAKDRGILFQWHNGSAAKKGFFGWDRSTQKFTFIPDATISSEVVSGSVGILDVASITGSAATLTTARSIALSGDASGSQNFDGSAGITISTTLATVNSNTGSFGDSITIPSFTVNGKGLITAVSTNTVRSGSTSQTGVLQLTDSIASTSTTTAATPNSVKTAYDLANAALPKSGGTMTGKITTVTTSTSTANILLAGAAADPSSPVSGDFWNNNGTLKFYNGSATKTLAFTDSNITGSAGSVANALTIGTNLSGTSYNGSSAVTIATVNNPVFSTSVTTPITYGGTSAGSTLTLSGTSNGSPSNAYIILNGSGEGNVAIGNTTPTSKLDITTNSLGTIQTTSSGLALVNTTAASSGNQQISPAIRWSGKGWKTDTTAASQAVDFRSFIIPVQGTANPTGYLTFEAAINGGSYSTLATLTSGGLFTSGIFDKGGQVYNAKAYGCVGDGTTDDRAALNTLVNTIMSAGGKLLLPAGTYKISSDITIPSNVDIDPSSTGILSADTGVTVTILCNIPAEAKQFFTGAGTFKAEGNYKIQTVFPEWFGASPSASASTNTPAIGKAHIFAFGNNRWNGTNLHKYNRRLIFSGMYQINDTNVFYHTHGAIWEGLQQFGCGFTMTVNNKTMFNFQSITRTKFINLRFDTQNTQSANEVCFILLDYDSTTHSELSTNPDMKVQNVRFHDCFFVGNNVAKIGVWIGKTPGSQGDNVSFHECYLQGFTYAGGVIGGNNTAPLTNSGYNYNTLHVLWAGGDIQSCKNGLISYGGNWIVRGTTLENQSAQTFGAGTVLEEGVDFYAEAALRGMVIEDVLSESYRLFAGDDVVIRNLRQQGSAAPWYVENAYNLPGSTSYVGLKITGTGVGGDGKMYSCTNVGTFGGLTATTLTGGSTTTAVVSGASWTTDQWAGMRCSVISGTGKYLYGVISSNTSTTITVTSWLTKYQDVTDTAPTSGSVIVIEPDWGTATGSGTVTFVQQDFYAIQGVVAASNASNASFQIDGLSLTHQGKVRGTGTIKNASFSRQDWYDPNSFILDDTDGAKNTYWENIVVLEGQNGQNFKKLAWIPPRNRSGAPKYANSKQMGWQTMVWSAGQTGGGTSYTDLTLGRGDGATHNNTDTISRNVLAYGGTLGKQVALGTNIAGLDGHLQVGLSTGTGIPGKQYILTGSVGSSGATVNPSDLTTDAYFDYKGLRPKSYTYATLPASANGQILYCSDGTPSGTLAGSSTGCLVQRLNGAWERIVKVEGGSVTANSTTTYFPYLSATNTYSDSPLYRINAVKVGITGNGDTAGAAIYIKDSSTSTGNARDWAIMNAYNAYGALYFLRGTSEGADPVSSGAVGMVLTKEGRIGTGGILSPPCPFAAAGDGTTNTTLFHVRTGLTNYYGISMNSGNAGSQIYSDYGGTGVDSPMILGCFANKADQLYLSTSNGFVGLSTNSPTAKLHVAGNVSATSWTTNGIQSRFAAATYTNTNSSGTVSTITVNSWAQPTLAASSSTTYTDAATLYIANAPTSGTNVTITNPYSLQVAAGNSYFGGKVGLGVAPTAILHLPAGTATANTAPVKLTSGTALTTPEDGAIEYHSSHLYFTIGSTRYQLDQQSSGTITSFTSALTTKTADYTATSSDHKILCDTTNNVITITLPSAASIAGREYIIKDWKGTSSTYNITVVVSGGTQTIDGSTSFVINTPYDSITCVSDGSNYSII